MHLELYLQNGSSINFCQFKLCLILLVINIHSLQKKVLSMNKKIEFGSSSPLQDNQLDMSSIQDNAKDENLSNDSDLNIQQMGLQQMEELEDEQKFKANIQQLLCTDRQYCSQDIIPEKNINQNTSQSEFEGEPLKGSFLRDMEALGKTISFESTCYNIYEGYCENEEILSSMKQDNNNNTYQEMKKLADTFKKSVKSPIEIEIKYVIDFSKTQIKAKKVINGSKKKHPSKSKMFSEFQNSTNSFSNCFQRYNSQKKEKKKSQKKKNQKNIEEQHRSSQLSWQINSGKLKKGSSSLLKKVRYNSTIGDLLRARKSEVLNPSLFIGQKGNKQQKKKKIQQKLNLRSKKT